MFKMIAGSVRRLTKLYDQHFIAPIRSNPYHWAIDYAEGGFVRNWLARLYLLILLITTGWLLSFLTLEAIISAEFVLGGGCILLQLVISLSNPTGPLHVDACHRFLKSNHSAFNTAALGQIQDVALAHLSRQQISTGFAGAVLLIAVPATLALVFAPDTPSFMLLVVPVAIVLWIAEKVANSLQKADANIVVYHAARVRADELKSSDVVTLVGPNGGTLREIYVESKPNSF